MTSGSRVWEGNCGKCHVCEIPIAPAWANGHVLSDADADATQSLPGGRGWFRVKGRCPGDDDGPASPPSPSLPLWESGRGRSHFAHDARRLENSIRGRRVEVEDVKCRG